MKETTKYKIQLILVFLLMIGALLFKFIPEYKASKGSSDSYLNLSNADDIVEIKINNKPNFAIITEKDSIIGILFFDKESLCLYNQNIETKTIEDGVNTIVEILIENNYLKSSSTVTFTNYLDNSYQIVTNVFKNKLINMNVAMNYQELKSTLEIKAKFLDLDATDNEQIVKQLELYSKDIIRRSKNNISEYEQTTIQQDITEEQAKEYTNNVYKKIENYVYENNIVNQDINNATLPITLIPATSSGNVFPDSTSWYYVQDSKVYAYISITHNSKNYSYCYQASIDEYKKGQC